MGCPHFSACSPSADDHCRLQAPRCSRWQAHQMGVAEADAGRRSVRGRPQVEQRHPAVRAPGKEQGRPRRRQRHVLPCGSAAALVADLVHTDVCESGAPVPPCAGAAHLHNLHRVLCYASVEAAWQEFLGANKSTMPNNLPIPQEYS